MKIRLTQTVEVDPDAWAFEYGIDRKDVRKDVQGYFSTWPQEQVDRLNLHPRESAQSPVK